MKNASSDSDQVLRSFWTYNGYASTAIINSPVNQCVCVDMNRHVSSLIIYIFDHLQITKIRKYFFHQIAHTKTGLLIDPPARIMFMNN